jgi:putative transposase
VRFGPDLQEATSRRTIAEGSCDTSLLSGCLSVGGGMLAAEMSRHTTFRFCLDPTVEQLAVLARHAGAARFSFNQCLGW